MDFKSNEKTFLSLFCGSCAVETKIKGFDRVVLNDIHEHLIALWKGLQNGYVPPDVISEEEYKYIRENKDKDKCLSGFVGFCCSFCGKWFGGYAREAGRNFALVGRNSLLRDIKNLKNAEFICKDYRNVTPPLCPSVIYADPPYDNTTTYKGIPKFNTKDFWEYMRLLSTEHMVFISEQNAPEDFISVWSKKVKRTVKLTNYFEATENLYVHKRNYNFVNNCLKQNIA